LKRAADGAYLRFAEAEQAKSALKFLCGGTSGESARSSRRGRASLCGSSIGLTDARVAGRLRKYYAQAG
jgi:hypothetical protein